MGANTMIKVQTLRTIRTVAAEVGSSYQAEVSLSMDNVSTHCTGGGSLNIGRRREQS